MNLSISPLNLNFKSSDISQSYGLSSISQFKTSVVKAMITSDVVFGALCYLSKSEDSTLSLESLKNLKQMLENEGFGESSVSNLVTTMIDKFDFLTLNGEFITKEDFINSVSITAAIEFFEQPEFKDLKAMLGNIKDAFCNQLFSNYSGNDGLSISLLNVLNDFKNDAFAKFFSNLESDSTSAVKGGNYTDKNNFEKKQYVTNAIQDYRTVTAEQLKSPINLSI